MKEADKKLLERLNKNPKMRSRIEDLLDIVENTSEDCRTADAAEQKVIEELRKMGNEVLSSWATNIVEKVQMNCINKYLC